MSGERKIPFQRRVIDRKRVDGLHRGGYAWDLKLECGHTVRLQSYRGHATKTKCDKCELGLVSA